MHVPGKVQKMCMPLGAGGTDSYGVLLPLQPSFTFRWVQGMAEEQVPLAWAAIKTFMALQFGWHEGRRSDVVEEGAFDLTIYSLNALTVTSGYCAGQGR